MARFVNIIWSHRIRLRTGTVRCFCHSEVEGNVSCCACWWSGSSRTKSHTTRHGLYSQSLIIHRFKKKNLWTYYLMSNDFIPLSVLELIATIIFTHLKLAVFFLDEMFYYLQHLLYQINKKNEFWREFLFFYSLRLTYWIFENVFPFLHNTWNAAPYNFSMFSTRHKKTHQLNSVLNAISNENIREGSLCSSFTIIITIQTFTKPLWAPII